MRTKSDDDSEKSADSAADTPRAPSKRHPVVRLGTMEDTLREMRRVYRLFDAGEVTKTHATSAHYMLRLQTEVMASITYERRIAELERRLAENMADPGVIDADGTPLLEGDSAETGSAKGAHFHEGNAAGRSGRPVECTVPVYDHKEETR